MPVEKIDQKKCVGCETCVRGCPMDVFRMDENEKKSIIVYQEDCQICHLCRIYCPEDAIVITPVQHVRPLVAWA